MSLETRTNCVEYLENQFWSQIQGQSHYENRYQAAVNKQKKQWLTLKFFLGQLNNKIIRRLTESLSINLEKCDFLEKAKDFYQELNFNCKFIFKIKASGYNTQATALNDYSTVAVKLEKFSQ